MGAQLTAVRSVALVRSSCVTALPSGQWWKRAQWATDLTLSDDWHRRELGFTALAVLGAQRPGGSAYSFLAELLGAGRSTVSRPETVRLAHLARTFGSHLLTAEPCRRRCRRELG